MLAFVSVVLVSVLASATAADSLQAFVDAKMTEQFAAGDLVGAVVAVVEVGEPTFAKGYGLADLESYRPVVPDRTLFRIGSITKLFVWTAVMQLVEQGALDLNADVNDYLSTVRVPDTFTEPVTMAHLMAHTAGFEDRSIGLFASAPDAVRPLAELLAADLPQRVRPVGESAAYSNHGAALAALVVEEVSGSAWDDYLETHILSPLGLHRTSGRQPVPIAFEDDLAIGYEPRDGSFAPGSFDYVPLAPAGSMSATADDMARFMLAHLQDGAIDGASILRTETAQAMHRTHVRPDPRLHGSAHGFIEGSFQGRRTIGHGGGIVAFHSLMVLVPDEGLGLFVAYNTPGGAMAAADFATDFFAFRYEAPVAPIASMRVASSSVVGEYRPTRVAHSTLDKLAGLLQAASVTATDDGRLVARNLGAFGTTRWAPVEPWVYREVDSRDLLVFQADDRGEPTLALLASQPHIAFEKLAWFERAGFHVGLVAISVLAFLSAVVAWPLAWRRGRGDTRMLYARAGTWTASVLFLAFVIGMGVVLRDPTELAFGVPPLLRVVLAIGVAGSALTLVGLLLWLRSWLRGEGSVVMRVQHGLVVASTLAFVWFLDHWNLLGFRY